MNGNFLNVKARVFKVVSKRALRGTDKLMCIRLMPFLKLFHF